MYNKNDIDGPREDIFEKMLDVLSHTADEATTKEVNTYISESPENRKEYESLKLLWAQRTIIRSSAPEEMNSFGKNIRNTITLKNKLAKAKLFSCIFASAAAIAVIALSAVAISLYNSTRSSKGLLSEISTKIGDNSSLSLHDGTQIRLHGNSKIGYPLDYSKKERKVTLSGAAYFDVMHDTEKPFSVVAGDCRIIVKGTRFELEAHKGDSLVTAKLVEGKIEFNSPVGNLTLSPGEVVSFNKNTTEYYRSTFDSALYMKWLEGALEFSRVTISDLCSNLRDLFGKEIILDEKLATDKTLVTMRLNNQETLDNVMNALGVIVPLRTEYKENKLFIYTR